MKRLAWLLIVTGLLLAQVQPVPAAMRPAALSDCCPVAQPCHDHEARPKPQNCSACLPCASVGLLAVLAQPVIPGAALTAGDSVRPHDEHAGQRRDPPPLPPPR